MKIAVDCEFNGFGGQLISMALVAENGDEWYAIRTMDGAKIDDWVKDNVLPVLWLDYDLIMPMADREFRQSLHAWLEQYPNATIIADWYTDLVHFFSQFAGDDHRSSLDYQCKAEIRYIEYVSEKPHNALADARALMKSIVGTQEAE